MNKIDDLNKQRVKNAEYLTKKLESIEWISTPEVLKNREHVYQTYSILVQNSNYRDDSVKFLNSKVINSFDIVVLMTDHDLFDYDLIKSNAKLIIDCRGRFEVKDNVQRG